MYTDTTTLTMPKFRDGVNIVYLSDSIEINYKQQGCTIDIAEQASVAMTQLFQLMQQGGFSMASITERFPSFADEMLMAISELDKLGLLTESQFAKEAVISGRQLYVEIFRFAERLKSKLVKSQFYQRLLDKKITRNELLGYALEYYHIVKLAPALLGPSLSNVEDRKTRKILQSFLAGELHHDKMLESSLRALDISLPELAYLQPLPSTFALCTTLGVLAKQHPLSFKASLFLFEQPAPEFNQAFLERCQAFNLPREFYQPIIKHSDINEDGDHDDISRELLAEVPMVAQADVNYVKMQVAALVEFMAKQDQEIVSYYSDKRSVIPRAGY